MAPFWVLSDEKPVVALRKQAAERSRRNGYRFERTDLRVVRADECEHCFSATGVCMICSAQVVSGPVPHHG